MTICLIRYIWVGRCLYDTLSTSISWHNLQTTGHKFNKFCKKCQNCGISWPYLESPWEIHSTEYKHAWYWFSNSWNNLGNVRILGKTNTILFSKPIPRVVSVKSFPDVMIIIYSMPKIWFYYCYTAMNEAHWSHTHQWFLE